MCGIAGFTQFHRYWGDEALLQQMGGVIAHRGPDAHGEYATSKVGLCHRRLSIIDLSSAGNQPMASQDGDLIVVFNGEIYNFSTLRESLEKEGVSFRTRTDTEVILALYQKHGREFVHKIHGMFAIALWDIKKSSLLLVRDRLGKKPIYYYQTDNDIVFGSELKAILQVPGVPTEVSPEAVYDYFMYQYIPEPKSIFKNIYKLEPGHLLEIDASGVKKSQYWDVSFSQVSPDSEEEITADLREKLKFCVAERMVSDVPLGAFLSGGVDSSGVVAMMAESSDRPVTTCSIGFDSKKFDETAFAKIVADQYATDHHELTVKEDTTKHIRDIARYFDEPFADPSLVPTFFVSQLARQHVTVALAGDGGDESFAGYQKYSADAVEQGLRSKIPSFIRRSIFPSAAKCLNTFNSRVCQKGTTLLNALSVEPGEGFFWTNAFFTQQLWDDLALPSVKVAVGDYHPSSVMTGFYDKADTDDHLSRILYTDIKTYLPGDILVKVDRMSMANSLEVRAPILDHKIVEYAATIPSRLKFKDGEKKHVLKEAFKPYLSDDTLYRKKMGFSVPLAQWFRQDIREFAEGVLFSVGSGLSQFFSVDALRTIWNAHQKNEVDYSSPLWSFLMFELWWQHYMANAR